MKAILKTLITTIIILSFASIFGERETRTNLAFTLEPLLITPVSDNVISYHLNTVNLFQDKLKVEQLQKVASRKKTVAR